MLFWLARRSIPRRFDPNGCGAVLLVFAIIGVLGIVVKIANAVATSGWAPLVVIGVGVAVLVGLGVLGARMNPLPPPPPPLVPKRPPRPRPPTAPLPVRPPDPPTSTPVAGRARRRSAPDQP